MAESLTRGIGCPICVLFLPALSSSPPSFCSWSSPSPPSNCCPSSAAPLRSGSPACVFFQTALLAGYLYAHWLARRPHWLLHVALLVVASAAAVLWAARPLPATGAASHPIATVFLALSLSIGLPFLVLAATSPLMQVWWSRAETSGIPYRLYALSNLASLLALAAYPSVVEPYLTLRSQRIAWCCGFAAFAILTLWLMRSTRGNCRTREQ